MSTTNPLPPTPDSDKVSASALDFLLIELVPLAQRMAAELHARDTALLSANLETSATISGTDKRASMKSSGTTDAAVSAISGKGTLGDKDNEDEEEEQEQRHEDVLYRLDGLGYRVGQGLVERFSVNLPRPSTPLDMIKFICKDLWTLVFRKQIDNLKTNHRGTFVLTDSRFLPLSRMSVDTRRGPKGLDEALGKAQPFLYFPCGIIRGALSSFGLDVTVQAETTEIPAAVFQIRTVGSKP